MPNNAPKIKINNTRKYKAEVILYDPKKEIREEIGKEIARNENRTIIKPYDDYDIIAGQGTAAYEISKDLKSLSIIPDIYLCCCGGGGLIAGTSTYLKYKYPNIQSFAVEPYGFEDTKINSYGQFGEIFFIAEPTSPEEPVTKTFIIIYT